MRRNVVALMLAAAAAGTSGCAALSRGVDRAENAAARAALPKSEEQKLGLQVGAEVEQKSKLSTRPEVIAFVNRVGQRVAAASPNPDKWQFTFKVIDDPKTVNAFAIPGGNIYVYTGLIKAARDEAEIAGVLAHEVAHVTSRHIAKRLVEAYGLQALAGIALGQNPGQVSEIAAAIAVHGTMLKNSRDDEDEADAKAVVATSKSGYDPRGLVSFFQTLQGMEGKSPAILAVFSSHPATSERIANMERQIREKNLGGSERNAATVRALSSTL